MPDSQPLNVGHSLPLTIEQVVFGGDGLARHQGFVVFVPFTAACDVVQAKIVEVRKGYARAELIEVLQPAETRQKPFCSYFTQCGGCAYQHVDWATQLIWKKAQIEQLLRRICQRAFEVEPVITGSTDRSYRNRITVTCRNRLTGFHQHRRPNSIIDIETCPLASHGVNRHLQRFRQASSGRHEGPITIREPGQPRHFTQTNPEVAELLRAWVEQHAGHGRWLLDFFGGDGFLSRPLASRFEQLTVIEQSRPAVESGRKQAPANCQFIEGSASSAPLPPGLDSAPPEAKAVIVDPPRTGLDRATRERLIAIAPARLLYVSCDPATFCRDLKALEPFFELEHIQPFDMFPQTAEVEIGAALRLIMTK